MKLKSLHFILTIILLFVIFKANSQSIVVKSFRKIEATRIVDPLIKAHDHSRPKYTLIKVLTDQPGFELDFGSIGNISSTELKDGVKMYLIPAGAKRVTITNKKIGLVCTYSFGTELEEWIYEMVLSTSGLKSGMNEQPKTQWVLIKSIPMKAKIYIDDFYAGLSPYDGSLTVGSHKIKIKKL